MGGIRIISASAGSGKTHTLATLLEREIRDKRVRPEAVVATTFTNRAAAELQERVRTHLMRKGLVQQAQLLMGARFGTVNAVCGRLLSEFTFELGMSPSLQVANEQRAAQVLRRALESIVTDEVRERIDRLARRWETLDKKRSDDPDWNDDVQDLVAAARTNRIDAEVLRACAEKSAAGFVPVLDPPGDPAALERALIGEAEALAARAAACGDTTKGTAQYVEATERLARALSHGEHPPWSDWLRVALKKCSKKSQEAAEPASRAAAAHLAHPLLRQDVHDITGLLLGLAADALEAYQQRKRAGGLIDFTDQEVCALELLGRPEVQRRLRGRIDLVLVDEFQDTSPIQLAIFLRLAELAEASVWVGDQKQAIFGFRGTDPALMDAAIDEITADSAPETLGRSWRSRPALVQLTSAVFTRAFAAQDIPEQRVRLEPALQDEPAGLGPVVERWLTTGRSKDTQAACIAAGVARLLQERARVRDRTTGDARPARPCDVAVLCRQNKDCERVANALERAGVRAALSRPGLLGTHEGRLVHAGLRLWVDPEDRLARAELLRLLRHPDEPDAWLRLMLRPEEWRAPEQLPEMEELYRAQIENPLAGALAAFDLTVEALGVPDLCLAWGDARVRRANLDTLRQHAVRYVAGEATVAGAASPAGLLAYLDQLAYEGDDKQAAVADEHAVVVSTWHAAKGLEWPVVVLWGLDEDHGHEPFGPTVVSASDTIDFHDPLAGRWIRYWPRPYHRQQAKGELFERVRKHPEAARARDRGRREDLRLLYVTWTRARDRLVLAAKEGQFDRGVMGVLNREETLVEDPPLPVAPDARVPVSWAGYDFDLTVRRLSPPDPVDEVTEPGEGYLTPGPVAHPPAWVRPSDAEGDGALGKPETIGSRIELRGKPDLRQLGHAVHGFFAADRPGYEAEDRRAMAKGLLRRWGVEEALDAEDLVRAADALAAWVDKRFPGAKWHREMPIMHRLEDGSIVRGTCDLALETEAGWVIVDHKTYAGDLTKDPEHAKEFTGQLDRYAEAVGTATGEEVIGCFLYLPVQGKVIERTFPPSP